MNKHNKKILAIIGATGLVGRTVLRVLEERKLPFDEYKLFASPKSDGLTIPFNEKVYKVHTLSNESILNKGITHAIMAVNGEISREFAPKLIENGITVIDNSSYWRLDKGCPLIVPEVNKECLSRHNGIIANPNCTTIIATVVLKPLHDIFKIKRIVYSTYQSVSGAGMQGVKDLESGINGEPPSKFSFPIFSNVIPQIDIATDDGYTKEEYKMINETRKILNEPSLKITATAVRVPVYTSHGISVNVEFKRKCDINTIKMVLNNADGVTVLDDTKKGVYPMPINATNTDSVYVGRLRKDNSVRSGCNLWIVGDNLRKGAATNAVQILELLLKM